MTGPTFSVVLPTFNRASLLGRAIGSALAQSRPPAEVIVVDDGSTDDTGAVVASYGEGVRYLLQPNSGAAAARNAGIRAATSEWIAFLDSDDSWHPEHLASIADAIVATDGAAVLYFSDAFRRAPGGADTVFADRAFQVDPPHSLVLDGTEWVLRPRHPMLLPASVISRQALLDEGGFDERMRSREDTHLFYRLGLGRPLCAVPTLGVTVGADDVSGERLTERHGPSTASWWDSTRLMYEDLARRAERERGRRAVTSALRAEAAEAHWRLARMPHERSLADTARHVVAALRWSPSGLLRARWRRWTRS